MYFYFPFYCLVLMLMNMRVISHSASSSIFIYICLRLFTYLSFKLIPVIFFVVPNQQKCLPPLESALSYQGIGVFAQKINGYTSGLSFIVLCDLQYISLYLYSKTTSTILVKLKSIFGFQTTLYSHMSEQRYKAYNNFGV